MPRCLVYCGGDSAAQGDKDADAAVTFGDDEELVVVTRAGRSEDGDDAGSELAA
jgi:hypothetical protein